MTNIEKERMIQSYFNMWLDRDFSTINHIFSNSIYYSECYGPEYFSLAQIALWIDDMLKKQIVLAWDIKRFIHSNDATIVEWFFKERQGDLVNGFDGVSLIEFNQVNKISAVKEYASKAEHIAPYAT